MYVKPSKDQVFLVLNNIANRPALAPVDPLAPPLTKEQQAELRASNPFHGKTYEEGVEAGIKWMLGQTDQNPYPEALIKPIIKTGTVPGLVVPGTNIHDAGTVPADVARSSGDLSSAEVAHPAHTTTPIVEGKRVQIQKGG